MQTQKVWSPFSLFWALCLRAVRDQWRRIALMQTNREDCGKRYREIRLPLPPSGAAAEEASRDFKTYFTALAEAKAAFLEAVKHSGDQYIASVRTTSAVSSGDGDGDSEGAHPREDDDTAEDEE